LADLAEGDPSVAAATLAMRRTLSNTRLAELGLTRGATMLAADYLDPGTERGDGKALDPFDTVARQEAVHYMGDTLLRDTDAVSMRQSLEVRVPFLDLPLYEYVASLRGGIKRGAGDVPKALLRAACADLIPRQLARRPKTGFGLPIDDWMRGEMRDACEAALDRLAAVPFIEPREVQRTWQGFLGDSRSVHWSRPLSLVVLGAAIG
jgi:asparagine synthase (glutamine-hydrolysing)